MILQVLTMDPNFQRDFPQASEIERTAIELDRAGDIEQVGLPNHRVKWGPLYKFNSCFLVPLIGGISDIYIITQ